MLLISNTKCNANIDIELGSHSARTILSPARPMHRFYPLTLVPVARGRQVVRHSRAQIASRSDEREREAICGEDDGTPSLPLAIGAATDKSDASGGLTKQAFASQYHTILNTVHRSVDDIFPTNKIAATCADCGKIVSRYQGYRHSKIGENKTLCQSCQVAAGLPIRDTS